MHVDELQESDPNGILAGKPGAKLDAGKVRVGLMMQGFSRALFKVSEITTFGALKYSEGGWESVPDGIKRYTDAMQRHNLKVGMGEVLDPDSGELHLAHAAWNALAILELTLRERKANEISLDRPRA